MDEGKNSVTDGPSDDPAEDVARLEKKAAEMRDELGDLVGRARPPSTRARPGAQARGAGIGGARRRRRGGSDVAAQPPTAPNVRR